MAYYKIKSLTKGLPKRHLDKNKTLTIEYRDGFTVKTNTLTPTGVLYISSPSLPLNFHTLRMKGLISVVEINKNLFMKLSKPKKKLIPPAKKVAVKKPIPTAKAEKPKKRTYKKKEEKLVDTNEE